MSVLVLLWVSLLPNRDQIRKHTSNSETMWRRARKGEVCHRFRWGKQCSFVLWVTLLLEFWHQPSHTERKKTPQKTNPSFELEEGICIVYLAWLFSCTVVLLWRRRGLCVFSPAVRATQCRRKQVRGEEESCCGCTAPLHMWPVIFTDDSRRPCNPAEVCKTQRPLKKWGNFKEQATNL